MDNFLVAAFLFAGLELLALWKNWRLLEFLAKPAVMVCLFTWLALEGGLHDAVLWFRLGILFSLAGDIALLFIDRFFIYGLAAFLFAQVAYLVGFNTPFPDTAAIWSVGIAIVVGVSAARVIRKIVNGVRQKGQTRLVKPIIIYSLVITLMLLSALLTLFRPEWKSTPALLVSIGASLFYLSDIVLAWNKFVSPIRHGRMLNIGLYHLGQIAIITGITMQFG